MIIERKHLSEREAEVLALVAEGQTNKMIGRILGISCKTVAQHCAMLHEKLEVDTRRTNPRVATVFNAVQRNILRF